MIKNTGYTVVKVKAMIMTVTIMMTVTKIMTLGMLMTSSLKDCFHRGQVAGSCGHVKGCRPIPGRNFDHDHNNHNALCTIMAKILCTIMPNDDDKLLILGSNTGSCSQEQGNSGSVTVEASLKFIFLYIFIFLYKFIFFIFLSCILSNISLAFIYSFICLLCEYYLMQHRPPAEVSVLFFICLFVF